jgi:amino acid transporter
MGIESAIVLKLFAALTVLLLTCINILSTRASTRFQDLFTFLKLTSLAWIAVIGLTATSEISSINAFAGSSERPGEYTVALYSALWAYDGWNNLNFIAGELSDPSVNLPRCIFAGSTVVIICYAFTNYAYFSILPKDVVIKSNSIAIDFGLKVLGPVAGILVCVCNSRFRSSWSFLHSALLTHQCCLVQEYHSLALNRAMLPK